MSVEFEFKGLDNLIKESQKVLGDDVVNGTMKKVLKPIGTDAHKKIESKLPRSDDPSKSGREGSRTGQHSADNVPISGVKNKNGRHYILVGWENSDSSPYFYAKFNEYGTSSRPPLPIFLETGKEIETRLAKEVEAELLKLLDYLKG